MSCKKQINFFQNTICIEIAIIDLMLFCCVLITELWNGIYGVKELIKSIVKCERVVYVREQLVHVVVDHIGELLVFQTSSVYQWTTMCVCVCVRVCVCVYIYVCVR